MAATPRLWPRFLVFLALLAFVPTTLWYVQYGCDKNRSLRPLSVTTLVNTSNNNNNNDDGANNNNSNNNNNNIRSLVSDSSPFLQALIQYPYILDKLHLARRPSGIVGDRGSRPASQSELERRQNEYHRAMVSTLLHPAILRLHILVNRSSDSIHLLDGLMGVAATDSIGSLPKHKIHIHVVGHGITYGDAFAYANRHMAGGPVLLMNSDTYPVGKGWDQLQPGHFGPSYAPRTVFMVSRYSPPCPGRPSQQLPPRLGMSCRKSARWGSADAFMFWSPVPQAVVNEMKPFPSNYWGAENRAAAALVRNGYGPLWNPCEILSLWHQHCSRVRVTGAQAPRVNRGHANSKVAPFKSDLPPVSTPMTERQQSRQNIANAHKRRQQHH